MKFKGRLDKEQLYPLLATYPLELVHMDFLTEENPCTGVNVNILVITDHFTQYTKAVVTPMQTAKAPTTAFWSEFITNYGFPQKTLTDQGQIFESHMIKELHKLASIQKMQTTTYHPKTNGQCERFNQTLINMIGTFEAEVKQHWKDYLPTLGYAYAWAKNNATYFSPYYLMYAWKPKLPIDIKFGLTSHNEFMPS